MGNLDKISGQVVHPPMEDNTNNNDEQPVSHFVSGMTQKDDTKELRIDGCNYEISKPEIRKWIEVYGEIKSEIEEVAIPSDQEGGLVGTGSYTVQVKLNRLIPHILPINGLKVKFSYNGVKKQCKNCYEYHRVSKTENQAIKKTYSCEKKTYDQYVEIFKENNSHILRSIMEHRNKVAAYSDGEKKQDHTQESNEDNNEDDNIDYNFYYENISN